MKTVIIGGGASGVMAAIAAGRSGDQVTIIEKNKKPLKKILATGNGRCNFTNKNCNAADFFSEENSFIDKALKTFGPEDALVFFDELGIMEREESKGRVYPYSEQALAIRDALVQETKNYNISIMRETTYIGSNRTKTGFSVQAAQLDEEGKRSGIKTLEADKLIIATGGMAGSQYGATGDGYKIAEGYGHLVVEPLPALVQLLSSDKKDLNYIKGVRAKGRVRLYIDRTETDTAEGEIQFTAGGVSGICIFDISRQATKALSEHKEVSVRVELLPEFDADALKKLLEERIRKFREKPCENFLDGIINNYLGKLLLIKVGIHPGKPCKLLTEREMESLVFFIKGLPFYINGAKGFEDAQVTTGGVSLAEVNFSNMESKKVKGLHFCGEVLDVDGICGGYNLQWAWTSGYLAGMREKK